MKKFLAMASALALLPGAAHAVDDAAPHVFKPTGGWTADFGDDYCRLSRPFSDGTQQISVAMERVQPGDSVRVVLVGDAVKVYRSANSLDYSLLPSGGEARKAMFFRSETPDKLQFLSMGEVTIGEPLKLEPGKPPVFPIYDRAAELKFADGVNALAITGGVTTPIEIDTGGLKAPMGVLQQCIDGMLTDWGLDAARHRTMTRAAAPAGPANEWIPSGTVGFGDFGKLNDSANQLRVMVSAEGKPTDCVLNRPTLDKKTNDILCKSIIDKGQFLPALDAQGQPMASYWMVTPFFLMPPFKT